VYLLTQLDALLLSFDADKIWFHHGSACAPIHRPNRCGNC